MPDELQTLIERRDWLAIRAEGKRKLGWQTDYDEREHRALCWALGRLDAGGRAHGNKGRRAGELL